MSPKVQRALEINQELIDACDKAAKELMTLELTEEEEAELHEAVGIQMAEILSREPE